MIPADQYVTTQYIYIVFYADSSSHLVFWRVETIGWADQRTEFSSVDLRERNIEREDRSVAHISMLLLFYAQVKGMFGIVVARDHV